ncbi:unnamed protein product [Mytilus edulis]|uniref:Uncharacterized protein n=1 Tax=Mytilus edulis TaxID=6550 RepID=A0A8S3VIB3_MYTED|nr:unnamed protein product [Mytilus edulis]
MVNFLPDEDSVYNWTDSQTDLFLQDFPWSGGDARGEESSPIHFGTVFKEEPISGVKRFYEVESSRESSLLSPEKKKSPSKKGVKRRLITEDKENDQKMKRKQASINVQSIGEQQQIQKLMGLVRAQEQKRSAGSVTMLESHQNNHLILTTQSEDVILHALIIYKAMTTTYIIKFRGSRKEWNRLLESSHPSTEEYNYYKQELKIATFERTKEMVEMIEGRGVEFILIHPDPYPSPEEETRRREEEKTMKSEEKKEKNLHCKRREAERRLRGRPDRSGSA